MANQEVINKLNELEAEIIADEAADDAALAIANVGLVLLEQLKKDAALNWFRASVVFFELDAPKQDISININAPSAELVNDPYLTRLHNAFSAQAKIVTITCTDGVNV